MSYIETFILSGEGASDFPDSPFDRLAFKFSLGTSSDISSWEPAVYVHSSSSNIPAVDITSNIFFRDSGMALNYKVKLKQWLYVHIRCARHSSNSLIMTKNRVTESRKATFAQLSFDLTLISNGVVKKASLASLWVNLVLSTYLIM